MQIVDEIQKLVLEYKKSPSEEIYSSINNYISTYLVSSPLTRIKKLDDDERQELQCKLFVRKTPDTPCELERSLEKYSNTFIGKNEKTISFLSFFQSKISQRILDVCRKRENYTARNEYRRSSKKNFITISTEPEGLEKTYASSENLSCEVIKTILQKEIKDCFFNAIDRIKNPKYRDPYLFSILFADHLKYEELGIIFDIPKSSINSNMKRATDKFTEYFKEEIRKFGNIEPEELKHGFSALINNVRTHIDHNSIQDKKTEAIIKARFIHKDSPKTICDEFSISTNDLHQIEREVVSNFLNSLEEIRVLRNINTNTISGRNDNMGFYESFMQYMNEPPVNGRTRGTSPLEGEIYDCHEIIKMVLPTKRQEEQIQLRNVAQKLSPERIQDITEATALTAADISAAIDDPESYATQYNLLIRYLKID